MDDPRIVAVDMKDAKTVDIIDIDNLGHEELNDLILKTEYMLWQLNQAVVNLNTIYLPAYIED